MSDATVMAGIPATNLSLYHRVRFSVGDAAAIVDFADGSSVFICRDIELARARKHARADEAHGPGDYAPEGGLSADRETGTAQALAELLCRRGVRSVRSDRTLPLIFAEHIRERGISVEFDAGLGVAERRAKDEQEVAWLGEAQAMTERAMEMACGMIGRAEAGRGGVLMSGGEALTSDRVRQEIDVFLLKQGYLNPECIVAGGAEGSDCHNRGSGELRTGEPVIVDIYPQNRRTKYNGDCTRTVVHGAVPEEVARMHAVVVEAKRRSIEATRAGVTGDAVYRVCLEVMRGHGFERALLPADPERDFCSLQHGLGHGVGLEVHEAPLLDVGGPELVVGDAVTIEPGLYHASLGGVRVEDMVIVTRDGCENLNRLDEGLTWA